MPVEFTQSRGMIHIANDVDKHEKISCHEQALQKETIIIH